jgi:hypothetical protein
MTSSLGEEAAVSTVDVSVVACTDADLSEGSGTGEGEEVSGLSDIPHKGEPRLWPGFQHAKQTML